MAHCYAELAVSPARAETIASTHCTYTQEVMARLSGLENIGIVYPPKY